jgi:hypothetical protein
MTLEEAKQFLRSHQPLPPDEFLTQELIGTLDEVREYLLLHPDPECVPLLIGVIGAGSGYGVYQLIEDVLLKFPTELVVPHLKEGLRSPHGGVRCWSAEFAASFPSPSLVEPLAVLLRNGNYDEKSAALTALEQIQSPCTGEVARSFLAQETDEELRSIALEIAQGSESKGAAD